MRKTRRPSIRRAHENLPTRGAAAIRWRLRTARAVLRPAFMARRHIGLGPADVGLVSYPRSGSNWLSLMLAELLVGHDVDFFTRPYPIPWIADYREAPRLLRGDGRLVKSHEPYRPEYNRVIYVVRHPVAVAQSYHRAAVALGLPPLDPERFTEAWLAGTLSGAGTWNSHVLGWLDSDAEPLVIRYERLVERPENELALIAEFLRLPVDEAAVRAAIAHNSLERSMQKRADLRLPPPQTAGLAQRHVDAIVAAARPAMSRLGYQG